MTDPSEARIQQQCVKWYRNKFCLRHHSPRHRIFSIPNERQSESERIRLTAIGLSAGVADLCVLLPSGRTIWIEVKTRRGVLSKAQREFGLDCVALGHRYEIVRSLEDFQKIFIGS